MAPFIFQKEASNFRHLPVGNIFLSDMIRLKETKSIGGKVWRAVASCGELWQAVDSCGQLWPAVVRCFYAIVAQDPT